MSEIDKQVILPHTTSTGYIDTCTVGELIEALKQFPQDMPVITEGCDCFGSASGVIIDGSVVVIERDN